MLGKLLAPFTTATAGGTIFRDVFIMIGTMLTLLSLVGVLTPAQVEELRSVVDEISGQWPQIMTAVGFIMAAGMSIYRAVFKSSSNKAAVAAKEIDKAVPFEEPVRILTPAGSPDIIVTAEGKAHK